jgi:cell division protein FtsI (penicillin-binding protein 3)
MPESIAPRPNPSEPNACEPNACEPGSPAAGSPAPSSSSEPWRRRFVRELLYGRVVDRAAKTRARIGLTILVFALGYLVIAARLAFPKRAAALRQARAVSLRGHLAQ